MKTIQEYWAELVAAGLAPDWYNVYAVKANDNTMFIAEVSTIENILTGSMCMTICFESDIDDPIQLRSNGIDLINLKWQKPTEQDVGKKVWWNHTSGIQLTTANYEVCCNPNYMLLATHGRLCPTIEDFGEVYDKSK